MQNTANFKGIEFHYETISDNFGRRGEQHEFIYRDEPWFEDLGRKAIEITATGEWCATDEIEELRDGIREGGVGTFTHPRWGDIDLVAYDAEFTINERYPDSGRYTIRFHEAGEYRYPTAGTLPQIERAAQAALAAIPSLTGGGDFAAFGLAGLGSTSLSWLGDEGILFETYSLPAYRLLQGMRSFPSSYSTRPDASTLIFAAIEAIALGYSDARSALEFLLTTYRNFTTAVPPIVVNQFTQATYDDALAFDAAVRRAALIEAARLVQELEFTSTADAIAMRDELLAWFDAEMELGCDGFEELRTLKFEVMKSIGSRLAVLPSVLRFCFDESLPAVVIAHRIFCDFTRWEEVKEQNPNLSPLFMPREIEVLQ